MRVEVCASMREFILESLAARSGAEKVSFAADWLDGSGTGYSIAYENSLGASAFTTVMGRSPKRNAAATSGVPTVAESATS
jgi:hypothetical protein